MQNRQKLLRMQIDRNSLRCKTDRNSFGYKTDRNSFGCKTDRNSFGCKTDRNSFGCKLTETPSDANRQKLLSDANPTVNSDTKHLRMQIQHKTPSDANLAEDTFGCKFNTKHLRMQNRQKTLTGITLGCNFLQVSPSGTIFQTQQRTLQLRLGQKNGSDFSFGFQ